MIARKQAVAAAAAGLSFVLVLLTGHLQTASVVLEEEYIRWPDAWGTTKPMFTWNDDNVDMFLQGCKDGNQKACDALVTSDDALEILNKRDASSGYLFRRRRDRGPSNVTPLHWEWPSKKIFGDWDDEVPLKEPIKQKDFQGQDAGNRLAPDGQALLLMPVARLREFGMGSMPQLREKIDCTPGGSFCGPTRPAVDYGADIVLTNGWLTEDKRQCCPCNGKGARVTNYASLHNAGYYNPYIMEMCKPCAGCA